MKAVNYDSAPDPHHGKRADETQHAKERQHAINGDVPDGACSCTSALCKVNAEIIRLYDDRYQALDADCYEDGDRQQYGCLHQNV